MRLGEREKAAVLIAMRDKTAMAYTRGELTILVDAGGGPWGQEMICGAVVRRPYLTARKWCRTLEELEEFLKWRIFDG